MVKLVKERGKILKYASKIMSSSVGFERFFFFLLLFFMISHIVSCLWILTARFDDSVEGTWIDVEPLHNVSDYELYLTSFYFTIETITTIGYGDFHQVSSIEKIFCICTMILGVIGFSFASGTLASIL